MSNVPGAPTALSTLVPLLFVDDIDASVSFYEQALNFRRTEGWEPDGRLMWCRMMRDGVGIMLQQTCADDVFPDRRGAGVMFYIQCQAAEDVFARLREHGVVVEPPAVAFYGMQQVFVTDPDGYRLCFQNPVSAEAASG